VGAEVQTGKPVGIAEGCRARRPFRAQVNAATKTGRPYDIAMAPAAPSTTAGRATSASRAKAHRAFVHGPGAAHHAAAVAAARAPCSTRTGAAESHALAGQAGSLRCRRGPPRLTPHVVTRFWTHMGDCSVSRSARTAQNPTIPSQADR
jgi:hypothetical protein